MSLFNRAWSAFTKLGTIIAILVAFILGMAGTVYLSLRSPEVKVPEIVGKDRHAAEEELSRAGLNIRVRATRYSADTKPDTVLLQLPHAGEVVKAGQTVAVDVSRANAREGESSTSIVSTEKKEDAGETNEKENKNEAESSANKGNTNANENSNKRTRNKNTNNSNNANNSNNRNANNRNANNGNANRPSNANNKNTSNVTTNGNRSGNNTNANRRAPTITPPYNPGSNSNKRTP